MRHASLTLALAALAACAGDGATRGAAPTGRAAVATAAFAARLDSLAAGLDALDSAVARLDGSPRTTAAAQAAFVAARAHYKRAEALLELYFPVSAVALNGPVIVRMEENDPNHRPVKPDGFQVIEEGLFPAPDPAAGAELLTEVRIARVHARRLQALVRGLAPDEANIVDAARLELARIGTLGLAGFDSPVAQRSTAEAAEAIAGVAELLAPWRDAPGWPALAARLEAARRALLAAEEFAAFDRLAFLVDHLDPAMRELAAFRTSAGIPLPPDTLRLWKAGAASLFEADAWAPEAVAPVGGRPGTPALVALGERLFSDPVLSHGGDRSCASCHVPAQAFTDGRPRSLARDGRDGLLRNAPTMLNVALQRAYFADLRVTHLEDQITDVVANRDEMHGSLDSAAVRLATDGRYAEALRQAFGAGHRLAGDDVRAALAAYLRTLVRLDSRFDRYVRGDRAALDAEERAGFNLFMGKAKCGTCHFMPLFNGTVPPAYVDSEAEVLGVPQRPDTAGARLDPDPGVARITRHPVHHGAFKTPTVRNAELTSPYMHNGVYRTLEEVVDFYARGGGAGIGIPLEHQTLPFDRLELDAKERAALVAFMRALTDTGEARGPAIAAR